MPRLSPKIVLCNSFLYTNNIQKHYSVSRCVISIIIVIAPTKTTKLETREIKIFGEIYSIQTNKGEESLALLVKARAIMLPYLLCI